MIWNTNQILYSIDLNAIIYDEILLATVRGGKFLNTEKVKEILKNSSNYSADFTDKLIQICEKFIPDIEIHLKTISLTLPNFDIHDESHAENVLKNMLTISNYYEESSLKLTDI